MLIDGKIYPLSFRLKLGAVLRREKSIPVWLASMMANGKQQHGSPLSVKLSLIQISPCGRDDKIGV